MSMDRATKQNQRRRKGADGKSIMQSLEEVPTQQKKGSAPQPSNVLPPAQKKSQNPVTPSQSPFKSSNNNTKQATAILPVIPTTPSKQPSTTPSKQPPTTALKPTAPSVAPVPPRPTQPVPSSINPLPSKQNPTLMSLLPPPPPSKATSPRKQPIPPPPPPPQPPKPPTKNAAMASHMPVAQLPAITAPTPACPPPPPPPPPAPHPPQPFIASTEMWKRPERSKGTVDDGEASEKERKRGKINEWIHKILKIGIEGLKKEYRDAPNGGTNETAKVFAKNPNRNRYSNIPCCDATRIKVQDDSSFYIHANMVKSSKDRRFICAQAPLNETVEDFWRMIVTSGVEYIVMLCEFEEQGKSKSAVYFPSKNGASMKIGKYYSVTKVSSENLDKTLTMSTLSIYRKDKSDSAITVKHIHWHHWPDHGVPDNFISPLHVLRELKGCKTPIVVHCSAGVGRTGTLVLIFMILESLRLPEFCGVPPLLAKLRDQRYKSIQTELQYLYVYRCVLDYLYHKNYLFSHEHFEAFNKDYKTAEKTVPSIFPVQIPSFFKLDMI